MSLSTIFPVNPSHRTISALLLNKSLDSMFPIKLSILFFNSGKAFLVNLLPFESSEPIFSNPIRGLEILPKCFRYAYDIIAN